MVETMTNVDPKLAGFTARGFQIAEKRREASEDLKDLRQEMKGAGLSEAEVDGVMLAIRRQGESDKRKARREAAEDVFTTLPLFSAAT